MPPSTPAIKPVKVYLTRGSKPEPIAVRAVATVAVESGMSILKDTLRPGALITFTGTFPDPKGRNIAPAALPAPLEKGEEERIDPDPTLSWGVSAL